MKYFKFLTLALLFILPTGAFAAIAFDASTGLVTGASVSTLTYQATTTGSNIEMIVHVAVHNALGNITGVTWNGTNMIKACRKITDGNGEDTTWYLNNADSGVHNVVVTDSGVEPNLDSIAVSYNGVSGFESTTSIGYNGSTTLVTNITTVADNAWSIFGGTGGNGSALTPVSNITIRNQPSGSYGLFSADSGGPKTPAGVFTMKASSASQSYYGCNISLAPAASAPTGLTNVHWFNGVLWSGITWLNGQLKSSIKSLNGTQ